MSNLNQDLYLVGDIHGDWDFLFKKLDHLEITNCYLLHVGDGGEGFLPEPKQERQFEHHNQCFKKRNIQYLSIRGNHSNPSYFQGQIKYSNFELLPDYTYREFNGEKYLFIGGAISIDRQIRIPDRTWWENEKFVFKPELVKKVDVLVTHSGPSWNGNNTKDGIQSWCDTDHTLWEECFEERQDHDKLIELCSPRKHYCGHFHQSSSIQVNGCVSRILDMVEIVEHR